MWTKNGSGSLIVSKSTLQKIKLIERDNELTNSNISVIIVDDKGSNEFDEDSKETSKNHMLNEMIRVKSNHSVENFNHMHNSLHLSKIIAT